MSVIRVAGSWRCDRHQFGRTWLGPICAPRWSAGNGGRIRQRILGWWQDVGTGVSRRRIEDAGLARYGVLRGVPGTRGLVDGAADFVFGRIHRFFEFGDSLPQAASDIRNLVRAEKEKRHQEDQQQVLYTYSAKHAFPSG